MIKDLPLPQYYKPANVGKTTDSPREIKDLVPPRSEILRQKLEPFDFVNPPVDPNELAYQLADVMIKQNGIGLAANQIGLPYRVFALKSNPVLVCFNPRIVDAGTVKTVLDEGCLTFPGLFVKVARPDIIKVRYFEPNGNVVTTKFSGMTAHIFQHELDHLNGVLMTDHVGRTSLEMAIKKAKKLNFKYTTGDFA